ncbi:MAG: AsmA family protein [Gammaproteobacteria bacterium]|nr:AsmA family protein [Gammaproteobacteria bacterium]
MRPRFVLKVGILLSVPLVIAVTASLSVSEIDPHGDARLDVHRKDAQRAADITTRPVPNRAAAPNNDRMSTPGAPRAERTLVGSALALVAAAARTAGAEVTIESAGNQQGDSSYRIAIEAESLSGLAELTGIDLPQLGPVQGSALLSYSGGDYRLTDLKATIKGHGIALAVAGSIAQLIAGRGINLRASLRANTVADLAPLFRGKLPIGKPVEATADLTGVALPAAGPVELELKLSDAGTDWELSDIKGSIQAGEAQATVSGSIARVLAMKGVNVTMGLGANSLADLSGMAGTELPDLGPIEGAARLSDAAQDDQVKVITGKLTASNAQLTVNGSIANLRQGTGLDLTVAVKADTLCSLSNLAEANLSMLGPLRATAKLSDTAGTYQLKDLNGTLMAGDAEATVSGSIADLVEAKGVDVTIALMAATLADLSKLTGTELPAVGPLALTAKLGGAKGSYTVTDIKGTLKIDKGQLTVEEGFIAKPFEGTGLVLPVTLKADTLKELSKLADTELPAVGPVHVATTVSDTPEGAWQLTDLTAKVGKSDLSGTVAVAQSGSRPKIDADLASTLLNTREFIPDVQLAPTTVVQEGEAPTEGGTAYARIFPDDPIPFDDLRSVDANVTLKADHFVGPKVLLLDDVHAELHLKDGQLTVTPLSGQAGGGSFAANLMIDARSEPPLIEFDVNMKEASLGQIFEELHEKPPLEGGTTDLAIQWKGQGNSARAFAGSLNGVLLVQMRNYRLDNQAAHEFRAMDLRAAALFADVFRFINPFAVQKRYTHLECGILHWYIKDGIAAANQGIGFETDTINMIASGVINLKTERLEMAVRPEARKGLSLGTGQLASLVKVGGTLANPTMEANPTALLGTGAYIGVGIATAGISVLADSLLKKGLATSACATALASQPPKATQETQKGPIHDLFEGIKGVLGD